METIIHIHKDYLQYSAFIKSIPQHAYPVEKIYCNRRNVVEKTNVNGVELVIKRFRVPVWFNRVVYTFFRKSKAQRAYENALTLLELGISTPAPIAYIIQKRHGLFHTAWFVSRHLPYTPLTEFQASVSDEGSREALWKGVADFLLDAHQKKILFLDNNGGNILVGRDAEGFHFTIVDINRLRKGHVPSLKQAMCSFDQLGLNISTTLLPLQYYAVARNFNVEHCVLTMLQCREKRNRRLSLKRRIQERFA